MTAAAIRDPRPLTDRLIEAGEAWADLNAAAEMLEETKGTLLAKLLAERFDMPAWKAEAMAKSHPSYHAHLAAMVKARQDANRARVRYDSGKAYVELARSAESTRRAEMQMK